MPSPKIHAHFIEPMLLLRTETLPTGPSWFYELKFDGFRAEAIKSGGKVHLRSRNDKDFNGRYPSIVQALAALPDETVIDGEIVALDELAGPRSTCCRTTVPPQCRCTSLSSMCWS